MAGITWWTPARLAVLAEVLAGGASYRAAALDLSRRYRRKITRSAVEGICRAYDLHGRARAGPPKGNRNAAKRGD